MGAEETSLIVACFAQVAHEHGAEPAMNFKGGERQPDQTFEYDFGKFWRRVEHVTAHLQSNGDVQPVDRVDWLGFNHELQLVTLVACTRLGAVFLPLNFRLTVSELHQVMLAALPHLLVHDFVEGDKVLSTLPMFHMGGLCIQTLPALLAGVQVVLHPRFDPTAWLDEMTTR
jgi:fatty-acyl-CoA synthase